MGADLSIGLDPIGRCCGPWAGSVAWVDWRQLERTPLRASAAAVFRPLDTGGVILNVESGEYYELNATGRFLWEQLNEGAEQESLSAALASRYGIDPATAGFDVESFVGELRKRDLVD